MTNSNTQYELVQDRVRDQYEKFPYPRANETLDDFIQTKSVAAGCPSVFFHWYWPHEKPRTDLDILVAGCGTMQAVKLAINLPAARIVAIDLSQHSIEHTDRLAKHHGVSNIETHCMAIEDAGRLNKTFDLIFSTGVLHHLPDPQRGLDVLRSILRVNGSMYLMVYATYGRSGIYMMQDMLRRMGLSVSNCDHETLSGIQQLVAALPADHPLAMLPQLGRFNQSEELVDLFLHAQDRAYTIPELYDYLQKSEMVMQKLILRGNYAPACTPLRDSSLYPRISQLPVKDQLAIGELFRSSITMHFFITCRTDRPYATYDADPAGTNWRNLVPVLNPGVEFYDQQLPSDRHAWVFWRAHQFNSNRYALSIQEYNLLKAVNAKRTMDDLVAMVRNWTRIVDGDAFVRDFMVNMHEYDYIWFKGREI